MSQVESARSRAGTSLKRSAIFIHRWLGVALCLIFLLWFPSGIGIMYWGYPEIESQERLDRSPALDPAQIRLSLAEALDKAQLSDSPGSVRLASFGGRPVYRFRSGREETVVYADTGEEQFDLPRPMADQLAAAWTKQPVDAARVEMIDEVDQWTIQLGRNLPMWKYAWPNGEEVYVSESAGDVVQYTTRGSRLGAYAGPVTHWLYFTPLRKNGLAWSRVVIWSSGIGAATALLGIVVAVWMYSPRKRYRYAGAPTSIPYRGQKRWHMVFGLVFGLGAVTWAFSGMLSMEPFPAPASPSSDGREAQARVQRMLRGPLDLDAFAARDPREALAALNGVPVKQIELASVAGVPVYFASVSRDDTRIVPMEGEPAEFDNQTLIDLLTRAIKPVELAEVRVLEQYDRYYLDRRRERPLPVILARLDDPDETRIYVDPKSARIVGGHSASGWVNRWLYHGLHSLDFPWLYNYRPLWDIVVITFMVGGTTLCVTSLILAWRVLGRKLAAVTGSPGSATLDEDLVAQ
jgi:hypothetical protein